MARDDRPDILLIMTDQQRGDCLSAEGHPVLQTPFMDGIGGAGARFRCAYSTCPSCIPARRSLMAGQRPRHTGMVGYREGVEWKDPPPLLPQVLRDHGYQTALIGRNMHLAPARKRYGFEYQVNAGGPETEHGEWLARHAPEEQFDYLGAGPANNDWPARPWPFGEELHATNWTVTQALRWLKYRDPTAPFFLTVQFLAPHPPLVPPAFYMDRYLRTGVPDPAIGDWAEPPDAEPERRAPAPRRLSLTGEALASTRAAYYGLINHVDDQIRRLLRRFDGPAAAHEPGLGENTLVIFTSDHGEMLGDHHRWGKRVPFEASARVPMLVRGPRGSGIGPGAVIDEPVCLEDVMPTCLDAAGVAVPESVDGRSLLPLACGERPAWRDHLHLEHAPLHQTLTDGKNKFVWWVADGREQFFDLVADPGERRDRIEDPACAERVAAWRQRLIAEVADRSEGFSDGERLVPGVPYEPVLNHAEQSPWASAAGTRPGERSTECRGPEPEGG